MWVPVTSQKQEFRVFGLEKIKYQRGEFEWLTAKSWVFTVREYTNDDDCYFFQITTSMLVAPGTRTSVKDIPIGNLVSSAPKLDGRKSPHPNVEQVADY
jgi:hypothetical protein